MKPTWTADVANDPSRDYRLVVELAHGDQYVATILRSDDGELIVRWYAAEENRDVPVEWLLDVLERARRDLK